MAPLPRKGDTVPETEDSEPADAPADAPTQGVRDALAALERHFGHRAFLDGQTEVVSAILSGRDTLAVMPTGGGKSLCYQLPAMVMDGVTVVVSPLIALMKDQVDALLARGIPAAMVNSTLSPSEQREAIDAMRGGAFKLVYIAPERFRSRAFTEALREVDIALFAVDEAHCLSQWGHDFRPDYLRLGEAVEAIGSPQVAAFTATATPQVRGDILAHLRLRDPFECVRGFSRPNLSLAITPCEGFEKKFARLRAFADEHRTGIVYCATRKKVEEVADVMASWGLKIVAYHGGMSDEDRAAAQDAFISKKRDIAVATNAFGMGIDRPDVRFVAHFDVPGSVEAYYQEAGRAGRDGEPAACELLFNYADTRTQEFFIDGNNPSSSLIRDTYEMLRGRAGAGGELTMTLADLAEELGERNGMAVSSAISYLSRSGAIERYDVPGQRARGTRLLDPGRAGRDLAIDEAALAAKDANDREKLKAMVSLCYSDECRQAWILNYFGEADAGECGSCDNCQAATDGSDLRPPSAAELVLVQKALSGVARMSRRVAGGWEPRFGRMKIAGMLAGSRAKEILDARLDALSTYGLLRAEGAPYAAALFKALQDGGLLVASGGQYPTVTLTPKGEAAMRGSAAFRMRWPQGGNSAPGSSAGAGRGGEPPVSLEGLEFDESLFEKLREARNAIAEAEGLPPFAVFHNQTLEFLTRLKPADEEAALKIRGIGEKKAERFLGPLLEVIREHGGDAADRE